jgi:hypothetical protein
MTSIIPFISNEVFEAADIKVMSDAYAKVMNTIYGFGHPNKIVEEFLGGPDNKSCKARGARPRMFV